MKKFLSISSISVLLIFIFSGFASSAIAATHNFKTSSNVVYSIGEDGITHTTFTIILENTTSQYYATQYNLFVGFNKISNIAAKDQGGVVKTFITPKDHGNSIHLTFNNKVIGLGKKLAFTVTFDTPDVAKHTGRLWEVNIPGLANEQDFENFHVHVDVPKSFGNPVYTKPATLAGMIDYSKEQLSESGISIGFGAEQVYNFSLTYHLHNANLFPITTEIALPPDTNYQDVYIEKLDPPPTNVTQDEDGNWLAHYLLSPSQKIDVVADGKVRIQLQPKEQYLSATDRALYLKAQPYWQVNDKDIKDLAQELKTPSAIYQYVVNNLTYDSSRVTQTQERIGAVGVLKDPTSAVCLEFTDLFIALARAAGIPAREMDGFAYTDNENDRPLSLVKDILHAWPEYYDNTTHKWIMVDPTWQNTTRGIDYFSMLDYDHVTFTIKGTRSDYPIAAGGYKLSSNDNKKDVNITFGDSFIPPKPAIDAIASLQRNIFTKNVDGTMTISNSTGVLIPSQKVIIEDASFTPGNQVIYMPDLPPFGQVTVPLSLTHGSLTNGKTVLTIRLGDQKLTKTVTVASFFSPNTFILGGIIIGIISLGLFIITKGTRHLSILRWRR